MNVNETGNFIPRSTLFFYFDVVRSIGQVDKMEFDEVGQRGSSYHSSCTCGPCTGLASCSGSQCVQLHPSCNNMCLIQLAAQLVFSSLAGYFSCRSTWPLGRLGRAGSTNPRRFYTFGASDNLL